MMDNCEPMTLGSPLNTSAHSPQNFQSSKMLPGFLLGDTSLSQKSPTGSFFHNSPQMNESSAMPPHFRSTRPKEQPTPKFNQNKTNAPPVQSLADEFEAMKPSPMRPSRFNHLQQQTPKKSLHFQSPSSLNRSQPLGMNRSMMNGQSSPTQVDPFYTQGEKLTCQTQLDDTWVTIFGFPCLSASYVLQKFSQHGTIVSHKMTGAEGNYMHVKYESTLQARKALSRNGKILPGNIMIGVTPCIDLSVISKDENSVHDASRNEASEILSTPKAFQSPRPNLKQSLRPLTSAYRAASNENKVDNSVSTPQKSDGGFLSKAMDYVFG